jgi:hypothetical protein
MSRLVDQVKQAVAAFAGCKTTPALIGGLALAAHQVVRATRGVDFLADADDADRLHDILLGLGYRCVHRSENAANYLRGDESLDLLYMHRPTARRLLAEAVERPTVMGPLRVVSVEGLIGVKLQALVNDPSRTRDLDDIRALLRAQGGRLNMVEVQNTSRCSIAKEYSMNSSKKFPTTMREGLRAPLVGGDVPPARQSGRGDLSGWVDLMEAVEVLCPVWPRRTRRAGMESTGFDVHGRASATRDDPDNHQQEPEVGPMRDSLARLLHRGQTC